ncbi:hypothetical protein FZI85_17385 [Mycobacterium sp. CBMA293]|uniref:hypothetical protein n=1 Tax=unclassified Mycolicibacterium TaxID=2636767 RepID=UPI0012DCFA08|nr:MULTISPECIES: hypothetical protein [unclassified Mycolicibacterium]MUL44496.1 hypothetical protein [Mycolicibacterium sp. CBMA 360]MUL59816.1 hypothetical protein [Mycolicibacterium sp. CBMA 335]MUL68659.1 hypothetical protein [Mycolicibacterium sp. CBMA 311]MUL93950.1 hypothetical protein [Mycolicibacterium sp. CBMA 230]MUM06196.1 hypothetical protein [Mycolicibacterium sp. CBMA 213]
MKSAEFYKLRSRVANMTRHRPADDAELLDTRKQLQELILIDSINAAVAKASPLSEDVRQRVIGLLSAA